MKLGYLYIPPVHRRKGRFACEGNGRAGVARALGFAEFYEAAALREADDCGMRGAEGDTLLRLRDMPPRRTGPRLASSGGVMQDGIDVGLPIAPQGDAAQASISTGRGVPFSGHCADSETLSRQWSSYVTACTWAGHRVDPRDWRVSRSVFVSDTAAVARDMVLAADSPCRNSFRRALGPDAREADVDVAIESCVLYGDPAMVADSLTQITRATAVFGTLVLADHPWADTTRALRSMVLLGDVVQHCFRGVDRQLASGWR